MLTVTPQAADAVKKLVEGSDVPDGAGLRIYSTPVDEAQAALNLTLVAAPEETDQVIEADGTRVFLDASSASFLDDKVLNASFEDTSIQFAIETLPEI